jgi:hypothetical protein
MSAAEPVPEVAVDPARGKGLKKVALALVGLGLLVSILGFLDAEGRGRLAHGYLLAFVFVWSIVLGAVFFVALQHATGSIWSVVIRRIAEMFASPMWLVALLFVPILVVTLVPGDSPLLPWAQAHDAAHEGAQGHDQALAHALEVKAPYLNTTFFLVRTLVFFLVWGLAASFFVRRSLAQDDGTAGPAASAKMRSVSAPFIIVFAFTVTFASFDWLMSLEPQWFSTIFGVYVWSGMTVASLAAVTIGVVGLRAKGWLPAGLVTQDHLYSLGALLFAFTCFWAYIAFSQYMLIWYANIPEETFWFADRFENGWFAVSLLLAFVRFVIPFFLLLSRRAKMDPRRLVQASVLVLFGQLVDLYWLIMPTAHGDSPKLGWQEVGPSLLLTGILVLALARFLGHRRLVAVGDPLFERSRNFHL